MNTSDQTDKIIPALVKAQANVSNPKLNATVSYGNTQFRYADLGACLEAVRGPLLAEGIAIVQDVAPMDENGVAVTTRLIHTSGQWIESSLLPMPVKAHDPQAVGSATTYGKRYTLCSLLGIVGEADDDGQRAQQAKPEAAPKKRIPAKRINEVVEQINGAEQIDFLQGLWSSLTNDERANEKVAKAKELAKERLAGVAA